MHHHLSLRTKLIVMISVMASLFLVALDQTIIATALGNIVEQFNAFDSLSWIVTAYLITTTIFTPIAGKFSDLFGRRLILLIGVVVFTIGSLLSGMAGNVTELIAWRALQGIGGGIITANAFTIVGDLFAARERGRWQGLIGAVFGLSSVVGPLLGGWLTDGANIFGAVTDWRWTFFINVPVGIAAFILIAVFCPPLKHDNKPKVDYLGTVLMAFILATLILAVDNTADIFSGLMAATGISLTRLRVIMFTLVAIALGLFMVVEHRAEQPIMPLKFFKHPNYVLVIGVATLFGGSFMGAILYLTQFNQQVFGATPTESGLMLLPMVAGMMTSSITSGQLISRIGRYKIFMIVGFIIATLSILALTLGLNPDTPYWFEAIVMVVTGLGMGIGMPTITLAVQAEFTQHDLGVATSSTQLFRGLGTTIGTAIFGAILTAGVLAGTTGIQNSSYVEALKSSPAAEQLGDLNDSNTLLNINMPNIKSQITTAAEKGFAKLPATVAGPAREQFYTSQKEFSDKVVHGFSNGLHDIFLTATALMAVAALLTFGLKERVLKAATPDQTPGAVKR